MFDYAAMTIGLLFPKRLDESDVVEHVFFVFLIVHFVFYAPMFPEFYWSYAQDKVIVDVNLMFNAYFLRVKDKNFYPKTSHQQKRSVFSMNCQYCGEPVKEFEDFVLVGKYPTRGQMWKWSEASYYVKPENYGKIYHKNCFITALKKENAKPE